MSLSSQDKRIAARKALSSPNLTASKGNEAYTSRIIQNVDLISEGPIAGLVNGPASVYYDGVPLMEKGYAARSKHSAYSTRIQLTAGSSTGTLTTTSPMDLDLIDDLSLSRPVNVIGGQGSVSVTATATEIGGIDALSLTTSSSFFDSGMIGGVSLDKPMEGEFVSSQLMGNTTKKYIRDVSNAFSMLNTGDKVQYKLVEGTNNISGLTHNAYYYIARNNNDYYFFTTRQAALATRLIGKYKLNRDYSSARTLSTNPNNPESVHSLVWIPSNVVPKRTVLARLKGNPKTGWQDIEGRIYSVQSSTAAIWLPDAGNGHLSAVPPADSYTLEVDKEITLKVTKPVDINSGLTVGGMIMAGAFTQVYSTRGRFPKSYNAPPEGQRWGYNKQYRPKFPFEASINDSGGFSSSGLHIRTSFNNVKGHENRGYTFIGYFKPPSSGNYHFKLDGAATARLWVGEHATERGTFKLKDRHICYTKPSTGSGRHFKKGISSSTSKPIFLRKDSYYPVRFCFHGKETTFSWKKAGGSYSKDLSNYFYTPDNRDWQSLNNVKLSSAWSEASGTFPFDIGEAFVSGEVAPTNLDNIAFKDLTNANVDGASVAFRVGQLFQKTIAGGISAAISNTPQPSAQLLQHNNHVVDPDSTKPEHAGVGDTIIQATSPTGLNLTTSQVNEVDYVRITFDYPSGIQGRTKKKGTKISQHAKYEVFLQIKPPGATDFDSEIFTLATMLNHTSNQTNALTFEHSIFVKRFGPMDDFKIIIRRITVHTGDCYADASTTKIGKQSDWATFNAESQIGVCTSYIIEKTTYPFSALAKTTFSTKSFTNMPRITYHCRGLKVRVPHNYITREESRTGVAKYTRNSSGEDTGSYVFWNGTLRDVPVYTNNPAWIFYDIVTNDRYGLGDFIKTSDLDIYALYKIARYCDELVDDGFGGKEPRFTCNLYITRPVDCYKLLKDMATIFRGLIYWHNSKITPVIDMPKDPIYNFSKANVVGGNFKYESTGSKTRANQVVVTWNNPKNSYQLEALLVEDRKNIIKTGRVLTEKAVAFGCTSEAQARRYGYWKLWTAANQTRVVSFEASIEGNFISPGDIINISDQSLAKSRKRLAGRVSATNTDATASTTVVLLDSPVYLDPVNTYKLSIVLPTGGALLAKDTTNAAVVITDNLGNDHSYYTGDYIQKAWVSTGGSYSYGVIDTEQKAANARVSASGADLVLSWSEHSVIQTKDITLPGGHTASSGLTSVTVSEAFDSQPTVDSIWIVEEITPNGLETTNSGKQYKVLSISEGQNKGVSITAVEHYNEKFDSIENTGNFVAPIEEQIESFEGARPSTGQGSLEVVEVDTDDGTITKLDTPLPPAPVKDLFFKII